MRPSLTTLLVVQRPRRLAAAAAVTLALAACGSSSSTTASSTSASSPTTGQGGRVAIPMAGSPPQTGVPWFLTVGDSITFGFTRDPSRAGHNDSWPVQLQSLLAASGRSWQLYDTACPGETTTSYTGLCVDRGVVPALQGGSQRDAALAAIHAHLADLRLITVDLGSNDLLQARARGETATAAALLLLRNLRTLVAELQHAAPGVPLIVADFYDPLANADPSTVPQLTLVNQGVATLAGDLGVRLGDFYSAINTAPPPDASLCTYVDCAHHDIHPTVAGHARLAHAALAALGG